MAKKKEHTSEPNPKANRSTPSTQRHLEIAEIRNDTVILKDGTLRAVLLVSSVNFFLKLFKKRKNLGFSRRLSDGKNPNLHIKIFMLCLNILEFGNLKMKPIRELFEKRGQGHNNDELVQERCE